MRSSSVVLSAIRSLLQVVAAPRAALRVRGEALAGADHDPGRHTAVALLCAEQSELLSKGLLAGHCHSHRWGHCWGGGWEEGHLRVILMSRPSEGTCARMVLRSASDSCRASRP